MGYKATVLEDSPVSYWRLGESSGTEAKDVQGINPGTYKSSPTLGATGAIAGESDTAVTFNGTTQWVSIPDANSLDLGDTFTYEAWIKRSAKGGTDCIMDKGPNAPILRFDGSDHVLLRRNSVGNIVTSTITITNDGKWHHVVATKSGSVVHIYIDGVDVTGTVTNQTCTNTAIVHQIGASEAGSEDFFHGIIDEAAVFSTVLSKARVEAHYAAGLTVPQIKAAQNVPVTLTAKLERIAITRAAQSMVSTILASIQRAQLLKVAQATVLTPSASIGRTAITAATQSMVASLIVTLSRTVVVRAILGMTATLQSALSRMTFVGAMQSIATMQTVQFTIMRLLNAALKISPTLTARLVELRLLNAALAAINSISVKLVAEHNYTPGTYLKTGPGEGDWTRIGSPPSAVGIGAVFHRADPTVPRPEGFSSVEWMGSVEPENMVEGDTWIETP